MQYARVLFPLATAGAIAGAAILLYSTTASAQEAAISSTTSELNSTSSSTKIRRPRTEATPDLISELIQRSKARTEKAITTGKEERFGSEEPFTYDPSK